MDDCLFCKIIAGKIPSKKVYEDDKVYVFEDINPKAPTHVLIIPKRHVVGLKEATPEDAEILGYCQLIAAKIGRERGIEDGYRTVYNVGPRSGQSVFHLHLHMLGGRDMAWPPGEEGRQKWTIPHSGLPLKFDAKKERRTWQVRLHAIEYCVTFRTAGKCRLRV